MEHRRDFHRSQYRLQKILPLTSQSNADQCITAVNIRKLDSASCHVLTITVVKGFLALESLVKGDRKKKSTICVLYEFLKV